MMNFLKIFSAVIISLLFNTVLVSADVDDHYYIVSPLELKGVSESKIDTSSIKVQDVSLYNVSFRSKENIVLVDEDGAEILEFPSSETQVSVYDKELKKEVGYITLIPIVEQSKSETDVNSETTGEYLFYQKETKKVFNKLSSSVDGKLFFIKQGNDGTSNSMILFIGDLKNGKLSMSDYIRCVDNTLLIEQED